MEMLNINSEHIQISSIRRTSINIIQHKGNDQSGPILQAGQRRFGRNISFVSSVFKAQLLQLRQAAEITNEAINRLRESVFNKSSKRIDDLYENDIVTNNIPLFRMLIFHESQINSKPNDLAIKAGFTAGNNYLSLRVGIMRFEYSFFISGTETVKEVQQRIADAINAWNGVSVFANVTINEKTGHSELAFEFSMGFLNNDNWADSNVGLTSVPFNDSSNFWKLSGGPNCIYRVEYNRKRFGLRDENGRFINNDVQNRIDLHMKKTNILYNALSSVVQSKNEIIQAEAMKMFVRAFNSLLENDNTVWSLKDGAKNLTDVYIEDLAMVGIYKNKSGFLQVDELRFIDAVVNGSLERFINQDGINGKIGFINRIERMLEQLTIISNGTIFEIEV